MQKPKSSRSIRLAIAISLVIVVLTGAAYLLLYHGPARLITHSKNTTEELGRTVYRALDDLANLRPKVTVSGRTIIEGTAEIAELTTVEKNFEQTHTVETTWLGSTKRLNVKGRFTAKAGFDLRQAITIDVAEDGKIIRVSLPPARIHSLEQTNVEILEDENGYWNKITKEQRQEALNALMSDARKSIGETAILREAEQSFEKQIADIIRRQVPQDSKVIIEYPKQ
jgi:hypothetical protein